MANLWNDSWNQQAKLGEDPKWLHLRRKCLDEGWEKVNQYWEGNNHGDRRKWVLPIEPSKQISKADIKSLEEELNSRVIHVKEGVDRIRWGYSQKGMFSIKEAYNIKIRGQAEEDEIWEKVWTSNPWPKVAICCWLFVRGRILTWENL